MSVTNTQPDISKQQMAEAGFKAATVILDGWGCTQAEMLSILRLSKSSFYSFRKDSEKVRLDDDQLERLSYILNIHSALRIIFDNPENVRGFMTMPNHNAYFEGRKPLAIIASGKFSDLYEVAIRIDALRSGIWG
ncbi:MbcA/ParS/Xre antitoxin family protein [Thaumasiovibrio subtropicus]|uniref:MbcA/ParS/Xre antitoxin family protein n=1 Tax=Thaumasiovibrio subtropicus TaxID=1891207 RepID=UPI000B351AB3|nr:MbcA/ParS/Xre antitoxin family protein [Thaumasiovibrio subtropicus]